MNEKYQQLYDYLRSNQMTDLDSQSFFDEYSGSQDKYGQLYDYFVQNQLTDLSSDNFYNEYFGGGQKKKEPSAPSSRGFSVSGAPGEEQVRQQAGIRPYSGSYTPPAPSRYGQVMNTFVKSNILQGRDLGEISNEAESKYNFTEDDWRASQISQALEAPMEELPDMIEREGTRGRIEEQAALKAKANEAFLPRLVKDTFPNSPDLYEAVQTLADAASSTYNPVGDVLFDFADDMVRGVAGSLYGNDQVAEVRNVMTSKGKATLEQAEALMNAADQHQKFVDRYGLSAEMLDFQQSIQEAEQRGDNSTLAALYAIGRNPSLLPELTLSSLAGLFNTTSGAAFAGTIAAGAGIGALSTAPVAPAGAVAGALASFPVAMGAASMALETSASFVDLLRTEMQERGMAWTPANIQAALNNDDIYDRVRNRSVARGAIIGTVDALGAKAASSAARGISSALGKAGAATTIEAGAGAFGEYAGQKVAGQQLSGADILVEGLAEAGTSPLSLGTAYLEDVTAKTMPSYTINNQKVNRKQAAAVISSSTPEELKGMDIVVNNDPETSALLRDRVERSEIADLIDQSISSEDRRALINLELERRELTRDITEKNGFKATDFGVDQVRRRRITAIEAEIARINNSYLNRATEEQVVADTAPEAVVEAAAEPVAQRQGVSVDEVVNRPATLTSFGGTVFEQPLQGEVYLDGQQVVFESQDKVYELGNYAELRDKDVEDAGLLAQQLPIKVNADETIEVENEQFEIQRDLPRFGIEYDDSGQVTRVSLKKVDSDQRKMFSGQLAEDIAYQVLLSAAESPQQIQRIDEILAQDEELQSLHDQYVAEKLQRQSVKPREAQAAPQAAADKAVAEDVRPAEPKVKKKASPVKEKAAAPPPSNAAATRITRLLAIETDPTRMANYAGQLEELVARGVALTDAQKKELDDAREQLRNAGYTYTSPAIGEAYVQNDNDEVVFVPDSSIPMGETSVVSVSRPEVRKDGQVMQPAKVVVARGTGDMRDNKSSQSQAADKINNPRNKKELAVTMQKVFKLPKAQARANAEVADRMIGTMAERAGISKEEMYGRISWQRAKAVDAKGNFIPDSEEDIVLFQKNIEDSELKIAQEYFKNTEEFQRLKDEGYLDDNADISSIYNQDGVIFHTPDKFAGFSLSRNGDLIMQGQGGIFYPLLPGHHENGYFWASTKAAANILARQLNEAAKVSKDGKVRLVLVSTNLEKMLSNTNFNQGLVNLLMSFMNDRSFPLYKADVRAAFMAGSLRKPDVPVGQEPIPIYADIKAGMPIEQMAEVLRNKLKPENSSFAQRKAFAQGVIASLAKSAQSNEKTRKGLIKLFQSFSGIENWAPINGTNRQVGKLAQKDIMMALEYAFTEPALRDIGTSSYDVDRSKNGRVYAVIEADVNPDGPTFEAVLTAEKGLPTHDSYPAAIRLLAPGSKTTVRLFNSTKSWNEIALDPLTGLPITDEKRISQILPAGAGISKGVLSTVNLSEDKTDMNTVLFQSPTINEESINKNTKEEVDRIKGLPEADEDGATFNIDGTKYGEGQGTIVPVASFNTTQEELTPELISNYVKSMQQVFSTKSVRFGLYKFADSTKVSIDINIVVDESKKEEAIKFSRFAGQFSVFNLSDFSTTPTGASGKNPKTFTVEQYAEIAQRLEDETIDVFIQNNFEYSIPEEVAETLTDDGEGNYVFKHFSAEARDVIKPMSGNNTWTSREEASAISTVGGVAMYYVDNTRDVSANVPHHVKVPKNKVYYFNEDLMNFYDIALEQYRQKNPNMSSFPSFNHQMAWVTKVANEHGFEMIVGEWGRGAAGLRAQTTMSLVPVQDDYKMNNITRPVPNLVPGDNVKLGNDKVVITNVTGTGADRILTYVTNIDSKWSTPQTVTRPLSSFKFGDSYDVRRSRFRTYQVNDDGTVSKLESPGQMYFQNERAAVVMNGTTATIFAITNPDITSPLHELAHIYENFLTDEERADVLEWTGGDEWTRDTSEAFAMGFEKFLYDGTAPSGKVATLFSKFKKWIGEVYKGIKGTPLEIELNDKMRAIYERMFAAQEPENSTHNQQPVDGVFYQGPMNERGESLYEPTELTDFQAKLLWMRRKFQDRFADVMYLVKDIKAQGRQVRAASDFEMAEELMSGKTFADYKRLEARIDAAKKYMRDNKITSDDLSDYMYALHAEARNERIYMKYGKTDGSGMSNEEAAQIIEDMKAKYGEEVLETAADFFRDMMAENRQIMVDFGLATQEEIDAWEQDPTYVPLYGIAVDEKSSDTTVYPTGGAGIHVYGPASPKAKGRQSKATNVLANIISASTALRIKARKNEALQSLLNLVQENPSEIWEIKTEAQFGDDRSVGVRVNGQQVFIRFADANKAKQLKNMGVDKSNVIIKMLKLLPTSWLRKSLTTLNPEFFIPNFTRDLEAALFNAMMESEEGGIIEGVDIDKELAKLKKKIWPVMKTLMKLQYGKTGDPEITQYYNEMIEDGGLTGWVYSKPLSEIAEDLQKDLSPNKLQLGKEAVGEVFNYIEKGNDAIEQTVRLAAYIAARERGVPRNKAAQLAKNITVNFNKYGEYGLTLNQFKMFFGASIQGSYRFFRTMGTRKTVIRPDGTKVKALRKSQKLGMALFAANSVLTAINIAMSDDDEDGESFYSKISDHDKGRNLIIMYDGDKFLKLPFAYGYSMISSVAEAVTSAALGERKADDAFFFSMSSIINSFSPVQFGNYSTWESGLTSVLTPSGLMPFGEAALNETFFGTQVYREQLPFGKPVPEYQLSFKSPQWLKESAGWVNEATGGSEYRSGVVDFNPDRLHYYYNFYIGGFGRFVDRSGTLIYSASQMAKEGEKVRMTASDLPLARQIYGESSKFYDYDKFKGNVVNVQQLVAEYEDPNTRSSDKGRYGKIFLLRNQLKVVEKKLERNRKAINEARKIDNYVDKQNRIFELYEEQREIMMMFNKLYDEKGPKED